MLEYVRIYSFVVFFQYMLVQFTGVYHSVTNHDENKFYILTYCVVLCMTFYIFLKCQNKSNKSIFLHHFSEWNIF